MNLPAHRLAHVRRLLAVACVAALTGASVPGAPSPDPLLKDQWGLAIVGAPAAWPVSTGEGVTVAVVDTGVDLAHEDLSGRIVSHVNCVGAAGDHTKCSGSGQDDNGHGTHVAGIAAASTNNGRGVASMAPDADIIAVRVLQPDGNGGASGSIDDVVAGIDWAVEHGADVVNLSLGPELNFLSSLFGNSLQRPINDAWDAGVIPVVAAGNDSLFPSGYRNLNGIVVTATDEDDEQASYASNVGSAKWGLAAPGGDGEADAGKILSTWWSAGASHAYGWASGTSMATPHVSGAAALLLALGLDREAVVDRLLETAVDLGTAGRDSVYGSGRLDAASAVDGLGEPRADRRPEPQQHQSSKPQPAPPPAPAPPATVAGARVTAPPAPVPPPTVGTIPPPAPEPEPTDAPEEVVAAPAKATGSFDPALSIVGAVLLAFAGGGLAMARRARRHADVSA